MAEPDRGTDSGVTPDDPSSTGSAPAQGRGISAQSSAPAVDDAVEGDPADTLDPSSRQVVRKSAPLRRRKPKGSATTGRSEPTDSSGPVDSDPIAAAGGDTADRDTADGDTAAADTAAADVAAAIVPDPSDVERGVGYRQRRPSRGSTPRAGVTYSSAKKAATSPRWVITGVLAVVVLVVGVAVAAVFALGTHRYDTQNELRAEYSSFARQMIVNLTTLNKDNVDEALKTLEDKTSGKAKQQMQDSMKQAAGLITEQNLNTKTTILSDAVTKADPDEGSVIVVYGWQMDPVEKGEEMTVQTFRWRVDITRINGDLKMTNFEWVT